MTFHLLAATTVAGEGELYWSAGMQIFMETGFITVLMLLGMLIFANVLRRKIPIMRNSLMPTAVIGGLLILVVKELLYIPIYMGRTGGFMDNYRTVMAQIFNINVLNLLVYHLLPIGFIAIGLRDKNNYEDGIDNSLKSSSYKKVPAFRSGAVIVSTYLVQGILGLLCTISLALVFSQLAPGSGIILPLGFGQGPGQATNAGEIFQEGGYANGRNFGIAVAGLGFIWASVGGVFMLNRMAKKRGLTLTGKQIKSPTAGMVSSNMVEQSDEIPLTESIDKFTIQVCLVGLVYLVTFFFSWLLDYILGFIPGMESVSSVLWGFNFCFGIAFAMLFKFIINKLRKNKVMTRKYNNNYMLNRISGFAFDFMIIASLAALSVADLGILWVPLLLMTAVGGLASIFYLRFICKRIYKGYEDESFASMYGTLTGTLSNGMILLRELDPNYKTPAAMDQVVGATTGIIFGAPILFLIPMAVSDYWVVLALIAVYLVFLLWVTFGRFGWLQRLTNRIFRRKAARGSGKEPGPPPDGGEEISAAAVIAAVQPNGGQAPEDGE